MATAIANPKDISEEEEFETGYGPQVTLSEAAKTFLVSWGDFKKVRIRASNPREAWAIFCDAHKVWPPAKTGMIFDAKGKQLYPTEFIKALRDKRDEQGRVVDLEYVDIPNPAFKK